LSGKPEEKRGNVLASLRLGSTIAARQLRYSLLLAIGLGLLIVAIRGYQDYQWLDGVYQQGNQRIISSSAPVATEVLVKQDRNLAEVMVRGMLNNRSIERVTLSNATDGVFFELKRPAGEIPISRWAEKMFGGIQTIVVPVRDPERKPVTTVGEMIVTLNPQVYVDAYMTRLSWSFLATMVLASVMAMCFAMMSYYVFSRPVIQLANYIVDSDPTDVSRPFQMPPQHRHDDEVQLLGSVTVGLFGTIRQQVGQLRKARDELQNANITLEERVKQRTQELKEAMSKLEVLASTDPLTELPNRRAYLGRLDEAISIWRRRDAPVSVILLDIDRFKALNDTYGHQAGDAVLVALAKTLKTVLRTIDLPARMGGEEFAVLLPGEEPTGAMNLAERLRKELERSSVDYGGSKLNFTCSFGVSGLPSANGAAEMGPEIRQQFDTLRKAQRADISGMLYSLADQALYQAKEGGRNRCKLADFSGLSEFNEVFPYDA
jgi:diguanylate cyclase (GGDEF)-like protein